MEPDMAHGTGSSHLIVTLVASAGGVDALQRVVGRLPESFPAAVLVLLHTDPTRVSVLPEILDRRSTLPVVTIEDGMDLVPGRVHVAPAGRHAPIEHDGRAALIRSGAAPPSRPSAALLLTTMAVAL